MIVRSVVVGRGEQGGLRIAPDNFVPGGGVLSQVLPVAGGLIEVNVGAPDLGLAALISDLDASAWWVPFVFGDDVAAALALIDEDDNAEARIVAVSPRDEELVEAALRLVYGFWLRRWAPPGVYGGPIQEWLVDAELGALAARAEVLFGSDDVAVALLKGKHERLAAALADIVRSTDPAELAAVFTAGTVAGVVQRAAFAAADLMDPDAPGGDVLASSVDALRSALRTVPPDSTSPVASDVELAVHDAVERSLADLKESLRGFRQEVFALTTSAVHGPTEGSGPVDWTAVHPRQLSNGEDSISWAVDVSHDEPVVIVTAAAPAALVTIPIEPGELYARVDVDGEIRVAAFEYDPVDEFFVARCAVASGIGALVSVYSDLYGSGGRSALDADQVRSVRAVVYAVSSRRARDIREESALILPFAFERLAVGLDQDARAERAVATAVDEIDLEWLVLSESTSTLRGGPTPSAAASFAGRDPRLAIRATVTRLKGTWRVRLISLGHEGPVMVLVRFESGEVYSQLVDLPGDGEALIEMPASSGDLPVAMRLTAIDR
ncbi:hypothetical protein AB2L57_09625 [Microbacterium sp. HA-8]|uniref:hypothetical protein n=1 Tax=Microbacterium sp. HA-8 TaxID=3234200 RepID=UPI0038F630FC